jgi:crossover junction endodeoxyribonuclease RuvC
MTDSTTPVGAGGGVIGLDLSLTSTGMVVLSNTPPFVTAKAITVKTRGAERLNDIWEAIAWVYEEDCKRRWGKDLWVLEGYAFGRNHKAAELGELGGVVKRGLWLNHQEMLIVPPSTHKQFITGKGNSQKDEVRLGVYKRWGFEHKSNDVVDAYGLAQIGLAHRGYGDLTAKQREVMAKMIARSVDDIRTLEVGK